MAIWNKNDEWVYYWLENPLKTWKKAKKYFKCPKSKWKIYWINKERIYSKYPRSKILDVIFCDLSWKDKYNSPRHEENPYIFICFFKKLAFYKEYYMDYNDEFGEKENGSLEYWEYLLDYLYYSKNLKNYGGWRRDSKLYFYWKGKEQKLASFYIPTVAMSLNKEGIKQLKKELNEKV